MFRKRIGFALLVLSAVAVLPGMNCGPTAPTPQNIEIIIDNQDSGFIVVTGTWETAATTDGNGCYGPDFRYHLADRIAVGVASFTPLIAQAGSYSVYIYWSADPNRTTSQPVIVHTSAGDTTYQVNLQQNGNQWFLLGSHTFEAGLGSTIIFTTETDAGYCNADAIRLVSNF